MPLGSLLSRVLGKGEYFLFGEDLELERLLGCPLPLFPQGEYSQDGPESIWVTVHAELRDALYSCLGSLLQSMGSTQKVRAGYTQREDLEYEAVLGETLRHVVRSDRRLGLTNLFWVAHSLQVAEVMESFFRESGEEVRRKYQIHPLLAGIYRRLEERVLQGLTKSEERRLEFRLGVRRNRSLVLAVAHDQLSLTEVDLREFDPRRALVPENRRFLLSADAYEELKKILEGRVARAVESGEPQITDLLQSVAPAVSPLEILRGNGLTRYSLQRPVVEGLLLDMDGVLNVLAKNRILKNERERLGSWPRVFSSYLDLADCVLRSQIVCALRRSLVFSSKSFDDEETREKFIQGSLYRFTRTGEVMSNVRKVTVLFADLRNFLETSEKAISENDLASQLYRIFDPAAIAVSAFGGTIDKYLGDGFMATFGTGGTEGEGNMAALRAAVAIQHMLGKLREQERTDFTMGVSIHTGRVAVARFLLDGSRAETTPIGRQVSIAGRLSSPKGVVVSQPDGDCAPGGEGAGGAPKGAPPASESVTLDRNGHLLNKGIAVSGAFIEELKGTPGLESFFERGRQGYLLRDGQTALVMRFDYIGEAGFKGVEGKMSVFSLAAERVKQLAE